MTNGIQHEFEPIDGIRQPTRIRGYSKKQLVKTVDVTANLNPMSFMGFMMCDSVFVELDNGMYVQVK